MRNLFPYLFWVQIPSIHTSKKSLIIISVSTHTSAVIISMLRYNKSLLSLNLIFLIGIKQSKQIYCNRQAMHRKKVNYTPALILYGIKPRIKKASYYWLKKILYAL